MAEDGFADVADGFFGGHTAERRLEIMADSRVGAFGVVALILALGIKASSLAALFDHHGVIALSVALLVSGALSRVVGILPLVFLPPVRRALAARALWSRRLRLSPCSVLAL
jgi:adenosylcobinamide-GDP ribazoletransferase